MKVLSTYIYLKDVSFHAYHGVALQENKVGNTFLVDLKLKINFSQAMNTDDITYTVNYADVYNVLSEEMAITSKLLEHVCGRIAGRIFREFPGVEEITLKLSKQNPPLGADIASVGTELYCRRDDL